MEEVLTAISTVGFPIFVAMYSLMRLEHTIKEHSGMLEKLYKELKFIKRGID